MIQQLPVVVILRDGGRVGVRGGPVQRGLPVRTTRGESTLQPQLRAAVALPF